METGSIVHLKKRFFFFSFLGRLIGTRRSWVQTQGWDLAVLHVPLCLGWFSQILQLPATVRKSMQWLFVFTWPCSEVANCSGCHPAFTQRQLGEAAAEPCNAELRNWQVREMNE